MITSLMISSPCVDERDMKYEKIFLALFIFTKSIQGRKNLPTNSHPPPPKNPPNPHQRPPLPPLSASSPNPFKKHSNKKSTHHPPPINLSHASPAVKSRESFFDAFAGPTFVFSSHRFLFAAAAMPASSIPSSSSSHACPPLLSPLPRSLLPLDLSVTMPLSLTSLSLIISSEQNLPKSLMRGRQKRKKERKKEAGEGTRREVGVVGMAKTKEQGR